MGYRKILNQHGLRLEYDEHRQMSTASKEYVDDNGDEACIFVIRNKGPKFIIGVLGDGFHRGYFIREAQTLQKQLAAYGEVQVGPNIA